MTFQDQEKRRLVQFAGQQWGASSHVLPYEVAEETLHVNVRASALDYFHRHSIKWWTSRWDRRTDRIESRPTGHLNSSQVACVNHLEPARLDRDAAGLVLRNLGVDAEPAQLEDGYVESEWIGSDNYLGEAGARTRRADVASWTHAC